MKYKESFPFGQQTRTDKPVVSVLLTCGITSRFPEFGNIKHKALLPLQGRPIVDFVATALCNSQVEKVFVVHEPDEDLSKILTGHEKIIFVECNKPNPTLTDSVICSVEKLFKYYGENELNQKQIMFVPCDIPLVKAQDFNALISQTFNNDADYCFTVIKNSLLKEEHTGRHYRKVHFNELGDDYSFQSIIFIRSRNFRMPEVIGSSPGATVSDNRSGSVENLLKRMEDIRKHRHSVIGWVRFAYRITGKAGVTLSLQILFDLLRNSCTETKFGQAIYRTLNVKVAIVESQSATFSLDIDKPADLDYVSRLAMLKTENSSGK